MPSPPGAQPEARPKRQKAQTVDYTSMRVNGLPISDKEWHYTHFDGRSSLVSGGSSGGNAATPRAAGNSVQRGRPASGLGSRHQQAGQAASPSHASVAQLGLAAAPRAHLRAQWQLSAASSRPTSTRASPHLPAATTHKPARRAGNTSGSLSAAVAPAAPRAAAAPWAAGRRLPARLPGGADVIAAAAAAGATAGAAAGAAVAAAAVAAQHPEGCASGGSREEAQQGSMLLGPGTEDVHASTGAGDSDEQRLQAESSGWLGGSGQDDAEKEEGGMDVQQEEEEVAGEEEELEEQDVGDEEQQQQQRSSCLGDRTDGGRDAAGEAGGSGSGGWAGHEGGPAAAARRRSGHMALPAADMPRRGSRGKRRRQTEEEEEEIPELELDDDAALRAQAENGVEPLPGEDTSERAALIKSLLDHVGYRVHKMHAGIRMLADDALEGERSMEDFRVSTDSCPAHIIFTFDEREEGEPQDAPAELLALVELESKDTPGQGDGLIRVVVRWFEYWEDIVKRPDGPQVTPGDKALRNTRQLFLHNIDLASLDVESHLGLIFDPVNYAYSIKRGCTVLHKEEAEEQYGSVEAYLEAAGADAFWYRLQRTPGLLRFETAPRPGQPRTFQLIPAGKDLTFMDLFAGAGGASVGFALAGGKAKMGIEWNPDAHSAYLLNFPDGTTGSALSVEEALELAESGDPRFPRPGELVHLHASPPCQTLSSNNNHSSVELILNELFPMLRVVIQFVAHFRPKVITLEEVPQFFYCKVDGVPVRPWLYIATELMALGYQMDWRILAAASYGAPNNRQRCWLLAALDGYELPQPPKPRYYIKSGHQTAVRTKSDWCLEQALGSGCWLSLHVEGNASLPEAVTVQEAIFDLPRLTKQGVVTKGQRATPFPVGGPLSKYAQFMRELELGEYCRSAPAGMLRNHQRRGGNVKKNKAGEYPPHMAWDSLGPTVCTRDDPGRRPLHPAERRFLTVAENMRLQSFPHCMQLEGGVDAIFTQVGNGVPPLQAYEIFRTLHLALTGRPSPRDVPILKGWVEGREPPQQATPAEQRQHRQEERGQDAAEGDEVTAEGGEDGEEEQEEQPPQQRQPRRQKRDAAAPAQQQRRQQNQHHTAQQERAQQQQQLEQLSEQEGEGGGSSDRHLGSAEQQLSLPATELAGGGADEQREEADWLGCSMQPAAHILAGGALEQQPAEPQLQQLAAPSPAAAPLHRQQALRPSPPPPAWQQQQQQQPTPGRKRLVSDLARELPQVSAPCDVDLPWSSQQQAGATSNAPAAAAAAGAVPAAAREADGRAAKRWCSAAAAAAAAAATPQAAQAQPAVKQEAVRSPHTRLQQRQQQKAQQQAQQQADPEVIDLVSDSEEEYERVEETAVEDLPAAGAEEQQEGWAAEEAAARAVPAGEAAERPAGTVAAAAAGAAGKQAPQPVHVEQDQEAPRLAEAGLPAQQHVEAPAQPEYPPDAPALQQQQQQQPLALQPRAQPPAQPPGREVPGVKQEQRSAGATQPQATAGSSFFVDLTGDSDEEEEQASPPAREQQQPQQVPTAARPAARAGCGAQGEQPAAGLAAAVRQQQPVHSPAAEPQVQPQAFAGQSPPVRPTPRRLAPAAVTQAATPYSGNFDFPDDSNVGRPRAAAPARS
ncbi:hypothetical protein ABPG75_012270 [Micractinium tetrahymenae]